MSALPVEPPISSVIAFRVVRGDRGYDYVSLRAGDGLWYTTGGTVRQRVDWPTVVAALRTEGVREVYVAPLGWRRMSL